MKVNYYIGHILLAVLKVTKINLLLEYRYINNLKKTYSNVKVGKPRLFWGPIPIKNNHYFSNALAEASYDSSTVMFEYFASINSEEDFDYYIDKIWSDLNEKSFYKALYGELLLLKYFVSNYDVFHIPYSGGFLSRSRYKNREAELLKSCGKKIIMMAFGGDFYMYSKIKSLSLQHVLQVSYPYPINGEYEQDIAKRFEYWTQNTDFIIGGIQCADGYSIWHNLPVNYLAIDINQWKIKKEYSVSQGGNEVINILHSPNHKGFKGTEFIENAIAELKNEGYCINFILLEGVKNSEVQRTMIEKADVLIEQMVFGYGLNAVEGMATGLPVLSNLDDENYTRVLRRYSYLNECPILSTTPETIKENLRILIENPKLRKELGQAGRKYVEKYHSYKAAQYMFSMIYDKIWYDKDVDTMNMYHPLKPSSYNNQSPIVEHPLVENKLPEKRQSVK